MRPFKSNGHGICFIACSDDLPPNPLGRIVSRALAKRPEDRFSDGGEMRAAIVELRRPRASARLTELAFSQEEKFPEYVDAILPLITRIIGDEVNLPSLRRAKDNIVDLFPEKTLGLLSEVLPDNVRRWPFGIDDILTRIGDADSSLLVDSRLIELKRKWNAR